MCPYSLGTMPSLANVIIHVRMKIPWRHTVNVVEALDISISELIDIEIERANILYLLRA